MYFFEIQLINLMLVYRCFRFMVYTGKINVRLLSIDLRSQLLFRDCDVISLKFSQLIMNTIKCGT